MRFRTEADGNRNQWLRECLLAALTLSIAWNILMCAGPYEACVFPASWLAARWFAGRRVPARRPAAPRIQRCDRRSGQMIIFVTLSLFVLFSMIGLSVDLGYSYYVKVFAQAAADSAAAAAVVYANKNGYVCGSGVTCGVTYTCPSTLTSASTPLQAGCLYANKNGFKGGGNQSVTLIANNTAVPNESGNSPALWIQANATQTVPHLFLFWVGSRSGSVSSQAIAAVTVTPNGGCAYILDTGNTQDAFSVSGTGSFSATGCGVNVWSSNSKAMEASGNNARVVASKFNIHGGYNTNGGAYISPAPTTGVAVPSTTSTAFNPLVNLPAPTFTNGSGGCQYGTDTTPYATTVSATISPGVYCGGINVSGGTLTLTSGVYILNGGGLSLSGNGYLSGSNVMFFLTGQGYENGKQAPLSLQGRSINLTAPNGGTYQGILFFQDPGATYSTQNVVNGGVSIAGSGTWYFPTTTLAFAGTSGSNATTAFVVKDLSVSGTAVLNQDITGTLTGLAPRSPGLVQ